jgi:O-antigen biosynthesis protein
VRRRNTAAILRLGKRCEQCLRRGRYAVRRMVAGRRLRAAARRVDTAAIVAGLADGPPLDVVLLAAAAPADAAAAGRVADAWIAGLVPPRAVWIATGTGPRPHGRPRLTGPDAETPRPGRPGRRAAHSTGAPLRRLREAVGMCRTSHVVLAAADTWPEPDALAWMTAAVRASPGIDAVYGDELVCAGRADGHQADPEAAAGAVIPPAIHHQPDFSWLYLLSRNFLGGAVLHRTELVLATLDALLARNAALPPRGDVLHAVAIESLRHATRADVHHVPHPLSRRGPSPAGESAPGDMVAAALEAAGIRATVDRHPDVADLHRIRLRPARRPRVSIIVPTHNAATLVASCLGDLRSAAGYDAYDVTVIDHDSDEPALRALLHAEARAGRLTRFPWHGSFNFAAMNNAAVAATRGSLLVFINNDVDGFSPGWLGQLVATFELDPRIAAAGALLSYPDGDVQHAGIVLDPKRMCHHAHYGWPRGAVGYQGRIHALQEYSAVTAALMMVRRDAFEGVGGFDERFPDEYNDVDLCLRLRAAGHAIAYNPVVRATHWEGRTRRVKESGKGVFQARWREAFARDPWSHPRFGADDFRTDGLDWLWREMKLVALAEAAALAAAQPAARPEPAARRRSA